MVVFWVSDGFWYIKWSNPLYNYIGGSVMDECMAGSFEVGSELVPGMSRWFIGADAFANNNASSSYTRVSADTRSREATGISLIYTDWKPTYSQWNVGCGDMLQRINYLCEYIIIITTDL